MEHSFSRKQQMIPISKSEEWGNLPVSVAVIQIMTMFSYEQKVFLALARRYTSILWHTQDGTLYQ
jgi:hypothetical protein